MRNTLAKTSHAKSRKPAATSYKARELERSKAAATKKIVQEIKAEQESEKERKRAANLERRRIEEEKARIKLAAEKMSAKKLQRLKKRLGRTKKVNA